ncbi:TPA: hypothetical protein OOF29_002729 [Morganella morganii]|nr:hypothetical protein [Morganella morganii]
MRYLINDLIIYDAKLKTISNRNFEDDSIKLTPGSVAVLLDFFISYPHTVWTKTEIGEKAFADSTYTGSESNVNKSLSLLRRGFKDVGEDSNIITTLPSQGIVFNANVIPYDDVSAVPVQASCSVPNKKRCVLIAVILATLIIIPSFHYFSTLETSGCRILNRGNLDAYVLLSKNIKELSNCKAPGVIINGAHQIDNFKNSYSLVAMCDRLPHNCLNYIQK